MNVHKKVFCNSSQNQLKKFDADDIFRNDSTEKDDQFKLLQSDVEIDDISLNNRSSIAGNVNLVTQSSSANNIIDRSEKARIVGKKRKSHMSNQESVVDDESNNSREKR